MTADTSSLAETAGKLLLDLEGNDAANRPGSAYNFLVNWQLTPHSAPVWNLAAEQDPAFLNRVCCRLTAHHSHHDSDDLRSEQFVESCFQVIRLDLPQLSLAVDHALYTLMELVFTRHPRVYIWRRGAEQASAPEERDYYEMWHEHVLLCLEAYICHGEKIERKDIVSACHNDVTRRRALDVLIVAYVRWKLRLSVEIKAITAEMDTAQDKKTKGEMTVDEFISLYASRRARLKELGAKLATLPTFDFPTK